jgi:AP-2 complex subunit beta-1
LRDYIAEVDVEFVRLCIRTIGRLAVKLPEAADKCVHALVDSLERKSSLVL